MNILLVEDDEDKRRDISTFISENLKANLDIALSFQSGKKAICNNTYDLILLDMTIPTFDLSPTESGGRSQPFGGRNLLSEMLRRRINTKVIVITQFDLFGVDDEEISLNELDFELKKMFPKIYFGAISFSIGYEDWERKLLKKIRENV